MQLTIDEKERAINFLKKMAIKYQKYELSARLRDREKKLIAEMSPSTNSLPIYLTSSWYDENFDEQINYEQYQYLIQFLDEFESNKNYQEIELRQLLKLRCINIIRDEKIKQILKND